MMVKHTVCPSCSAGCGVNIIEMEGSPVGTYPYKRHPVNEGKTCRIGRECYEIPVSGRLTAPALKKSGRLSGVNWDEALQKLAEMLSSMPSSIITTGTLTNEEAFRLSKLVERVEPDKSGVITVFPKFDYPEIDIRTIKDRDNIAVIGDVIDCAPLIGRRLFHAMASGADVRSYDTREITRTSLNTPSHTTFSQASDLVDSLRELPEGSLVIITHETPWIIGEVIQLSSEMGFEILPIFEDFNTRGVMQHMAPISDIPETDFLWLIDPGAVFSGNTETSGFLALQSIGTGDLDPDMFLATAAWCEKSGSYTSATGYTVNLEPALKEPEGVLTDGEIFDRILANMGD